LPLKSCKLTGLFSCDFSVKSGAAAPIAGALLAAEALPTTPATVTTNRIPSTIEI